MSSGLRSVKSNPSTQTFNFRSDRNKLLRDRGRDDGLGRPSLRTEQADFRHSALQLVVTYKKIGKP